MLIVAQRAKDDLNSVQRAAREAVGLPQAYVTRAEAQGAAAFPNQAEPTLTKYSSTGGSRGGGAISIALAVADRTLGLSSLMASPL